MDLNNPEQREKFRQLLEEGHDWPCEYQFKFILPSGQISILKSLIDEKAKFEMRPSSAGTYTSLTVFMMVTSPDQVIEVYEKVSVINGLISL
jgi:uncharacterized protein